MVPKRPFIIKKKAVADPCVMITTALCKTGKYEDLGLGHCSQDSVD
jgi:hypothetical protein